MPKRKSDVILSKKNLSVCKKFTGFALSLEKKTRIIQYGSLFFFMRLLLVRIWRDNLPKCGRAITKSFLALYL